MYERRRMILGSLSGATTARIIIETANSTNHVQIKKVMYTAPITLDFEEDVIVGVAFGSDVKYNWICNGKASQGTSEWESYVDGQNKGDLTTSIYGCVFRAKLGWTYVINTNTTTITAEKTKDACEHLHVYSRGHLDLDVGTVAYKSRSFFAENGLRTGGTSGSGAAYTIIRGVDFTGYSKLTFKAYLNSTSSADADNYWVGYGGTDITSLSNNLKAIDRKGVAKYTTDISFDISALSGEYSLLIRSNTSSTANVLTYDIWLE